MPSIIPSIPIDLDSRRHLLFTQGAVIMAEQELTKFWGREYYFFEAMQRILDFAATADLKKLSMANLAIILWQGCCHEDAQLTLQQVQAALPHIGDAAAIARLVRAILDAWQAGTHRWKQCRRVPRTQPFGRIDWPTRSGLRSYQPRPDQCGILGTDLCRVCFTARAVPGQQERLGRRAALAVFLQLFHPGHRQGEVGEPLSLEEVVSLLGHGFQRRSRDKHPCPLKHLPNGWISSRASMPAMGRTSFLGLA